LGKLLRLARNFASKMVQPWQDGVSLLTMPDRVSSSSVPSSAAVVVWGSAALFVITLFVLWPYQHWDDPQRSSVLYGWWLGVSEDAEWLFCPLVPLGSIWLAWAKRAELKALPRRSHWLGWVLLALSLGSYWVGYQADTGYPGFLAVQLSVAALILCFCGMAWMRMLLFPSLFLIFMWPAFPLEDQVAFPMRQLTSALTTELLNVMGIDTVREGTALLSAAEPALGLEQGKKFNLDVADPCSGIRSLYALFMLAALYGYLFLSGFWRRLLLLLAAMPLAIAGNLVRMVMLALASMQFGAEFAIGRNIDGHQEISLFHELAGYAVFVVALGGMFALSSLLEGKHWKRKKKGQATVVVGTSEWALADAIKPALGVLGMAAICLAFCSSIIEQPPLSPPGVNMIMPLSLGYAQGEEVPISQRERATLAADITLSRVQYLANHRPVLATLVLSGETRRGLHRPDVCLPGQGWQIMDRTELPILMNDGSARDVMMLRVVRDVMTEDGRPMRVRGINLFWYQGYGVATADYYTHVFYSYFDSIVRGINHRWALVSFFTYLPDAGSDQTNSGIAEVQALENLRKFIADASPKMLVSP
jgi:exosortase